MSAKPVEHKQAMDPDALDDAALTRVAGGANGAVPTPVLTKVPIKGYTGTPAEGCGI